MEEGASEGWDRLAELVNPGIQIERTFKATPQKVWAMWITELEKWFAPHPSMAGRAP